MVGTDGEAEGIMNSLTRVSSKSKDSFFQSDED